MNAPTEAVTTATISFATLPTLGAELEGGRFCGVTTLKDGTHAAVILLPNKAQERMGWNAAKAWAEEAGGELPSRPVSALLFATSKDQFEETWYWTGEQDESDASCAWHCSFSYGCQYYFHKSASGAAVAVRLIQLKA